MKFVILSLTLVSTIAFATEEKYSRHFENPVVDSRLEFTTCAMTGALIGVAKGQPGDLLCVGKLKGDISKKPRSIYAYKADQRKTMDFFEETSSKQISAVGEQEGGEIVWEVKLRELDKDLAPVSRAHVSTLHIRQTWDYSEGNVYYTGKLPGKAEKFEGPAFQLDTIDQELDQFLGEIGHR